MKKSTKGALAGGAAAFLLLGGVGSLAYWTDNADVDGTTVESGHLTVINNDCGSAPWELDGGDDVVAATRIVPGDDITKTCSFEIEGEGDHFATVNLDIASTNWNASSATALVSALGTVQASYEDSNGDPVVDNQNVPVGEVITANFTMTFDSATTGDTAENEVATLDDIAITVTQNHN
ncbi:alternate-type signal peptide domain-containing protein [Nocardioides sp. MH1]|uniref:alternate-type signal peptide domain-containing protein n=1 Tax=Nocardioides sp. MH1 TaxID=3242490 RepID=UPI0035204767